MSLQMPPVSTEVIARRAGIAAALRSIVPDGVIVDERELKPYESDGLTAYRQPPLVVVLPETTERLHDLWARAAAFESPDVELTPVEPVGGDGAGFRVRYLLPVTFEVQHIPAYTGLGTFPA